MQPGRGGMPTKSARRESSSKRREEAPAPDGRRVTTNSLTPLEQLLNRLLVELVLERDERTRAGPVLLREVAVGVAAPVVARLDPQVLEHHVADRRAVELVGRAVCIGVSEAGAGADVEAARQVAPQL